MIIFGTRTIRTDRGQGEFFCPQCSGRRAYRLRRVRSFAHVYFIPLFPVSRAQEVVHCAGCQGDFVTAVLEHDPDAETRALREAFAEAVRCVVTAMIAADAEIDPAELTRARQVVHHFTRADFSEADLHARAVEALDGRVPIDATLRRIAPGINEHGKELLIRVAVDIAASDGDLRDAEIELVERIADNLGMSKAHLRGILLAPPAQGEPEEAAEEESDRPF